MASLPLPIDAPRPVLRSVVFALASVTFAVAAHTSTERQLPAWWLIALAVPLVALASRPLADLEQRFGGLLTGLVAIQLSLHAAFVVAADERPGSGGAAGWLCCGASQGGTVKVAAHTSGTAAVVQLLLHLLAAMLIAVALRKRERALWEAVRTAVVDAVCAIRTLVELLEPAAVEVPLAAKPARTSTDRAPLKTQVVLTASPRRGPPMQALLPA